MRRAADLRRGSLSRGAVRALYGERISMSASRMERLRSCHFAYFMEYGLKARPRRPAAFDAPQIGTFLHYLLEHVTKDVLDRGGFAAVGEEDLHALVRRYIDRYAAEELRDLEGRNARFRYLFSRLREHRLCGGGPDRRGDALLRLRAPGLRALLRRPGRAAGGDGHASRTRSCGSAARWTGWTAG